MKGKKNELDSIKYYIQFNEKENNISLRANLICVQYFFICSV